MSGGTTDFETPSNGERRRFMASRTTRFHRWRVMLALSMAFTFLFSFALPARLTVAQEVDCTEWQSETLQIMAPASPGGGWDGTAREMQAALQNEGIVETVEVFNVQGASGTLNTSTVSTIPSFCKAACISRAVPSQPPPGEAGAMIWSVSDCHSVQSTSWATVNRAGSANENRKVNAIDNASITLQR